MGGIFISHAHNDQALAAALAALIEKLFAGKFPPVNFSSRKELEGSIAPGENWFRWIVEQVREADVAIILLTPNSVMKPWILWEAGAVAGAALSSEGAETEKRLYPLTFGLDSGSIPGPFSQTQVTRATEKTEINKLIENIYELYKSQFDGSEARKFGAAQEEAVTQYLQQIELELPRLPVSVTEAAVQEWVDRLERLALEKRYSEAGVLEDWMDVAFGRETGDQDVPLDARLHRRLADIYASAGHPAKAEKQYELARLSAPRDIFVMRGLGKARLDQENYEGCRSVIEEIESLDPEAFEKNVENAALKARWQKEGGNNVGAQETLEKAYERLPESHYLGDLLGQSLITSEETEKAQRVYRQVRDSLLKHEENNIWTAATTLTAAIVLGDMDLANTALKRIEGFSPSPGERRSIRNGLKKIDSGTQVDPVIRDILLSNNWIER